MKLVYFAVFALSFCLTVCFFEKGSEKEIVDKELALVGFERLTGFSKDNVLEALPALKKSCTVLKKKRRWKKFCFALKNKKFETSADLADFIKEKLKPYSFGQKGLFTGYYKPELDGALSKTEKFKVPVYGMPSESKKNLTRKEIDEGASDAEPIAWIEHKADLFIVQVQGSAVLNLPDGKKISLNYAGNNGHPFFGIGKVMAKKGIHDTRKIRRWLIDHPEKADAVMHLNKRYIYFKTDRETDAIGTLGVALTAQRSMAVDPAFVPLGAPVWLETVDPDGRPLRRLVVAQDTGSAIKGRVRGDFYWGSGHKALEKAGRMKSKGTYFILLPDE